MTASRVRQGSGRVQAGCVSSAQQVQCTHARRLSELLFLLTRRNQLLHGLFRQSPEPLRCLCWPSRQMARMKKPESTQGWVPRVLKDLGRMEGRASLCQQVAPSPTASGGRTPSSGRALRWLPCGVSMRPQQHTVMTSERVPAHSGHEPAEQSRA